LYYDLQLNFDSDNILKKIVNVCFFIFTEVKFLFSVDLKATIYWLKQEDFFCKEIQKSWDWYRKPFQVLSFPAIVVQWASLMTNEWMNWPK
jgi:hypothetical protein